MALRRVPPKFRKKDSPVWKARDQEFFDMLRLMKDDEKKDISAATGLAIQTIRNWYRVDARGTRNPTWRSRKLIAMAYGYEFKMVRANATSTTKTTSTHKIHHKDQESVTA